MALSWNEIKDRAFAFSKEWEGTHSEVLIDVSPYANPKIVYEYYKMAVEVNKKAPQYPTNKDLSPIRFMQDNYPFCSKYCWNICKKK